MSEKTILVAIENPIGRDDAREELERLGYKTVTLGHNPSLKQICQKLLMDKTIIAAIITANLHNTYDIIIESGCLERITIKSFGNWLSAIA